MRENVVTILKVMYLHRAVCWPLLQVQDLAHTMDSIEVKIRMNEKTVSDYSGAKWATVLDHVQTNLVSS